MKAPACCGHVFPLADCEVGCQECACREAQLAPPLDLDFPVPARSAEPVDLDGETARRAS